MSARVSSRTRGGRAGGRRPARKPLKRTPMANLLIRVSIVMGMLLLVPGLWALAVLAELMEGQTMRAVVMLLSWPVGGILIAGAVYYNRLFNRVEAAEAARAAEAEARDDEDEQADADAASVGSGS